MIARVAPDILLLTSFDYDLGGHALAAFADALEERDVRYPHRFAGPPNTGLATGLDLDGNGYLGDARDAQGYGAFRGQGGMAVLSRWPIVPEDLQDLTGLLWADLPGNLRPTGTPGVQRLSTTAHWDLPVAAPGGRVRLLAFHATPPVFDGPEDRNGRRNHDEARLWTLWLDGALGGDPPGGRFVILGDSNLDPEDGDGRPGAMASLLADPRIQDPRPAGAGGRAAASPGQAGDPALDTVDWPEPSPGNLRVDYVLPSSDWGVVGAGVFWPAPDDPLAGLLGGRGDEVTRHRLVWVDLEG